MALVDQMIVKPERQLVCDFLHSRKAKTSCSFSTIIYSIDYFFKDASGSIPGASRKRDIRVCFTDVSGSIRWKCRSICFAIFFIREKRKPAVFCVQLFLIQSNIFFMDCLRFPESWFDQMIVVRWNLLVFYFLHSKKIANQLFFFINFFIQSII